MRNQKNAPASTPKLAPAASEQLSAAELDSISGGLNPQPLPPMERRAP